MANRFECRSCGRSFQVPETILARHPGWTPRSCRPCRDAAPRPAGGRPGTGAAVAKLPCPEQVESMLLKVLDRHHDGPREGLFTDGSARPNPGPGGWAAVLVRGDQAVDQWHGEETQSTNNRMELKALIEAFRRAPEGQGLGVYTDSELAVKTVATWAPAWERAGWRRRSGPISNLDLVQELVALTRARPDLRLQWVPGHSGWRWNEYANVLAGLAADRAGARARATSAQGDDPPAPRPDQI